MATEPFLLAHLSGHLVRFALLGGPKTPLRASPPVVCNSEHDLLVGIQRFLAQRPGTSKAALPLRGFAIAAAGQVQPGAIRLAPQNWLLSRARLQEALGVQRVHVINDFLASALGTQGLLPAELIKMGDGRVKSGGPVIVLEVGEQFRVATMLSDDTGSWSVVPGQGGILEVPVKNALELNILNHIAVGQGLPLAEMVLSADGLVGLYRAAMSPVLRPDDPVEAARVIALARSGDRIATEAVRLHAGFLGSVAGNLAASFSAVGGVYILGGLIGQLTIDPYRTVLRRRFEGTEPRRAYLASIPLFEVISDTVVLNGLATLFPERLWAA